MESKSKPNTMLVNDSSKTVYASFGKAVTVSSQSCAFKVKEEQQCVKGVQPQVLS